MEEEKKSQNFHLQRNVVFDRVCGLRQAENGWKYLTGNVFLILLVGTGVKENLNISFMFLQRTQSKGFFHTIFIHMYVFMNLYIWHLLLICYL